MVAHMCGEAGSWLAGKPGKIIHASKKRRMAALLEEYAQFRNQLDTELVKTERLASPAMHLWID